MERALVIGASGGIGGAVVAALGRRGVKTHALSRPRDGPDLTNEASAADTLRGLSGVFDLVFVATGALEIGGTGPEKTIRAICAEIFADSDALLARLDAGEVFSEPQPSSDNAPSSQVPLASCPVA